MSQNYIECSHATCKVYNSHGDITSDSVQFQNRKSYFLFRPIILYEQCNVLSYEAVYF